MTSIAEIVFRSHFENAAAYTAFVARHPVKCSVGERLDPEGSFLQVLDPVPERPWTVEHMPGGVLREEATQPWTLEITWWLAEDRVRIQRRHLDGSVMTLEAAHR